MLRIIVCPVRTPNGVFNHLGKLVKIIANIVHQLLFWAFNVIRRVKIILEIDHGVLRTLHLPKLIFKRLQLTTSLCAHAHNRINILLH